MNRALLGLAASAAFVAISPAQGQTIVASGLSASAASESFGSNSRGFPGHAFSDFRSHDFRNCRGQHCRHIRVGDNFGYGGYNDYGDYDANRSFDPDKWNDWWNDRPERSFPRWLSRNQDCARQWYSGDVLTC